MNQFNTILELLDRFSDQDKCTEYLEKLIWKEGKPICPHCGESGKIYRFKSRGLLKCQNCQKQFTLTTGTIFHGTRVPLRKWFVALYLFTVHKKGVSARQLAKDIDVTIKTAWYLVHRIRRAVQNQDFSAPLEGTVTVDESFWGQKSRNIHYNKRPKNNQGRKGENKIKIFTMIDGTGRARSMVIPDTSGRELIRRIKANVAKGSTIQSDEWCAYNSLRYLGYNHIRCDHGKYQYVAENGATTNKCENFFSHLKRTFHGTYHKMTSKHMARYLAEVDFRFNTRNESNESRFNILLSHSAVRLSYKKLIQ